MVSRLKLILKNICGHIYLENQIIYEYLIIYEIATQLRFHFHMFAAC
jgi:hypothetical protein